MAISKMNLVSIIGPIEQLDQVVRAAVIDRSFHPENALTLVRQVKGLYPFEVDNSYAELLKHVTAAMQTAGIKADFRPFEQSDPPSHEKIVQDINDFQTALAAIHEDIELCERIPLDNEQILNQLVHMENINARLDDLFSFKYVNFRFGRLPREIYTAFSAQLEQKENMYFFPTSIERDFVYGMYMMPRVAETEIDTIFAQMRFERIFISDHAKGTPREAEDMLKAETNRANVTLAQLKSQRTALIEAQKEQLLTYFSYLKYMSTLCGMRKFAARTSETFYLIGWVPHDEIERLAGDLRPFEQVSYTLDDAEDLLSLSPPVKLKNWKIFKPFNLFVTTYGLPSYNELDPTAFMAITYFLLFGVMFGDIGQGLVLFLFGFILQWLFKMKNLGKILSIVGVASFLFGFLYGSVFGLEMLPGFYVLEGDNTNRMLISTVGLGVILLIMAFVINIINGIRQKNAGKTFFDAHGIAGFVLYVAIVMIIVLSFTQMGHLINIWYIAGLIILPLLVIFAREPLTDIAGGKKKWMPKKLGEFTLLNSFELIEVLLSFATNTISFVRVGAFALNHAGLMLVVYILSGTTLHNPGNIGIAIFGNIFVMALETLVVGVQVLRLEFYEMFGKFFDGNGREFLPVQVDYMSDS